MTVHDGNVVEFLREKVAQDKKFISDHNGYCQEYLQDARAEFVAKILEEYAHWSSKAESWDFQEDYCNVRETFLRDLLVLIGRHWNDDTSDGYAFRDEEEE